MLSFTNICPNVAYVYLLLYLMLEPLPHCLLWMCWMKWIFMTLYCILKDSYIQYWIFNETWIKSAVRIQKGHLNVAVGLHLHYLQILWWTMWHKTISYFLSFYFCHVINNLFVPLLTCSSSSCRFTTEQIKRKEWLV